MYQVCARALGKPSDSVDGSVKVSTIDIMVNLGTLRIERVKGTPDSQDEKGLFYMTYEHIYGFFYQYYISIGYLDADAVVTATADADVTWARASYQKILSKAKIEILQTLSLAGGKIDSLSRFSELSGYSKSLLSYHILGSEDVRGLASLGLVEVERHKRGRQG